MKRLLVIGCTLIGVLAGCGKSAEPAAQPLADAADTIYTGGDIVTINDAQPSAEALAVKGGKIVAVGTRAEVEKAHKGASTKVVDLGGKALLPGFLDAHSHYISSLTVANQVNVYAPPAGPGKDVDSIVAELVKFRDANKIPKGEVIQAYGYDENVMPKGRQLNRDDLDKALPDNPVLVGHVSMHGAVLNSAAMTKWGISAQTKTPPGGVIVRKPGTQEPWGLIMETAYLPIFASLPQPTQAQEVEWSKAGQRLYAQYGVTTAHEGATHLADLELMKRAAAGGATLIDVIAYPFITDLEKVLAKYPKDTWGTLRKRAEDRRREDHHRRLAAGQDGLLHHALPHRRPGRREELEGRTDLPRAGGDEGREGGLRHGRAAEPACQRRRCASTPSCARTRPPPPATWARIATSR